MCSLSRLQHGDEWDEADRHVSESSPEGQNAGNGSASAFAVKDYPLDPNNVVSSFF